MQNDVNPHTLRMLEGTFSLDAALKVIQLKILFTNSTFNCSVL